MAEGILWQLTGNIGRDWAPQFNQGYAMGEARQQKNNRRSILQSLAVGPDGNLDVKSGVTQLMRAGDPEGALQIGQLYKALQPETTDEIKEYNLYRQQGGTDDFTNWKVKLKQAGATKINNVVQTGDNQYAKTLGENDAKGFLDVNKAGNTANSKLNTLTVLDNLMKDPSFYSGFGGPTRMRANQALASLGIANPNAASAQEAFDAISKKMVLDLAGGSLGTGFSNADRDFIVGQVPALQNTPEGNRRLIEYMRKIAQREQQVAQLARQYAKANNNRFDQAGFNEFLAKWSEQNPLFANEARTQQTAPQVDPVEAEMRRRGLLR